MNERIRTLQNLAFACSKLARKYYKENNNDLGDLFVVKQGQFEVQAAELRLQEMGVVVK